MLEIGTLYLDDVEIIRRPKYDKEIAVIDLVAGSAGCSPQDIYTRIQNQGGKSVLFSSKENAVGIKKYSRYQS